VRAYPVSEGSGVEGVLSTGELRWRISSGFLVSGFYDYGHVKNYGGVKSYGLDGAGLELLWQCKSSLNVKLTWAHRLHKNPNPTSDGDDQDGSLKKDRIWVRIALQF
jgi:hemolysin activation/secretion protein